MSPQEGKKLLIDYSAKLSEHFDAVQIMVSYPWEGGTQPLYAGSGNWFARQGMAHDFIQLEEAEQIAREIGKPPGE